MSRKRWWDGVKETQFVFRYVVDNLVFQNCLGPDKNCSDAWTYPHPYPNMGDCGKVLLRCSYNLLLYHTYRTYHTTPHYTTLTTLTTLTALTALYHTIPHYTTLYCTMPHLPHYTTLTALHRTYHTYRTTPHLPQHSTMRAPWWCNPW